MSGKNKRARSGQTGSGSDRQSMIAVAGADQLRQSPSCGRWLEQRCDRQSGRARQRTQPGINAPERLEAAKRPLPFILHIHRRYPQRRCKTREIEEGRAKMSGTRP